jgi:hypothetical protein
MFSLQMSRAAFVCAALRRHVRVKCSAIAITPYTLLSSWT